MFCIKPETLQYWYKHHLSDYYPDIENNKWCRQKIDSVSRSTGAITEKPVYIFKSENLGENMSIDDKSIGGDGFTILSNNDTNKIAMMVESTKAQEVEQAMSEFGSDLNKIKNISMDMSPTYALVFNNLMPQVTQIIDKFHVMQYVYDAVSDVRIRIKKDLTEKLTKELSINKALNYCYYNAYFQIFKVFLVNVKYLTASKGKKKTEEDKKILSELELLRRVRHAITQSPEKWSEDMKKTVYQIFENHNDLKIAYQISQNFKHWYDYQNHIKSKDEITKNLHKWYENAKQIKEFKSVIKMIAKHENKIINFFKNGMTNANAERLNGKVERFVSNNYGIKNKDFTIYRIAKYFA